MSLDGGEPQSILCLDSESGGGEKGKRRQMMIEDGKEKGKPLVSVAIKLHPRLKSSNSIPLHPPQPSDSL